MLSKEEVDTGGGDDAEVAAEAVAAFAVAPPPSTGNAIVLCVSRWRGLDDENKLEVIKFCSVFFCLFFLFFCFFLVVVRGAAAGGDGGGAAAGAAGGGVGFLLFFFLFFLFCRRFGIFLSSVNSSGENDGAFGFNIFRYCFTVGVAFPSV